MKYTNDQLLDDIEFLANRQVHSGSLGSSSPRDTGLSSNSIVSIAYGLVDIDNQTLPLDRYDLEACERMWEKLPEHRKVGATLVAISRAREVISSRK